MSSWECFVLGCAAGVAGSDLMCLSVMEALPGCIHHFCLFWVMVGLFLCCLSLRPCVCCGHCIFHTLIFCYHVAMETTTVLCFLLLWHPANQCCLLEIICGGVSQFVPLLWLRDVCVVAVDFRGKPFELGKKEQTSFPFLVIRETQTHSCSA